VVRDPEVGEAFALLLTRFSLPVRRFRLVVSTSTLNPGSDDRGDFAPVGEAAKTGPVKIDDLTVRKEAPPVDHEAQNYDELSSVVEHGDGTSSCSPDRVYQSRSGHHGNAI